MGSATERLRKRLRLRFCAPFTSFNLSSYLKYLCAELWQGRPQFLPDARERACAAVHRCAATPADPGQEDGRGSRPGGGEPGGNRRALHIPAVPLRSHRRCAPVSLWGLRRSDHAAGGGARALAFTVKGAVSGAIMISKKTRAFPGRDNRRKRLNARGKSNQKNSVPMERLVIAANRASRGLAYLSTRRYVRGLNCWVRNGSRCFPSALAAITTGRWRAQSKSKIPQGFSPQSAASRPIEVENPDGFSSHQAILMDALLKAKART